jgi:hypothetical protein
VTESDIQDAVRRAVREELKAANIVDGPTHMRHHQYLEQWCNSMDTVRNTALKVLVTAVIGGIVAAVVFFSQHHGGR